MEQNNNQRQGGQTNFGHTNFNNQVRDQIRSGQKLGFIAQKKAQWNHFVLTTKIKLEQIKKTSEKVLRFIMVFYVIISAIITATVLIDISEDVSTMLDAYKRVETRTEEIKKEEIKKEFQEVSDAKGLIKTAQAATPVSAVETTAVKGSSTVRIVTAYNLVPEQTDNTPCVGAANQNLCYLMRVKKMNVCAANRYAFGTILKIPGYQGSQKDGNDTCVVLDVLAPKYGERIDISMDQDLKRADKFGAQSINITVIGYMEGWDKLAPAEKFSEPSR